MSEEASQRERQLESILSCLLDAETKESRIAILEKILETIPFGQHPGAYIEQIRNPVVRSAVRYKFEGLINDRKLTYDWRSLLSSSANDVDLEKGVYLISRLSDHTDLTFEDFQHKLDVLADGLSAEISEFADENHMDRVEAFRRYMFGPGGFRGNTENYYDPANSYVTTVLERKAGIPVTLSVLGILVARRTGFPVEGVNLPGHFLLRYKTDEMEIYLDAFNEGTLLSEEDCVHFLIRQGTGPRDEHFETPSDLSILMRMYRNLINYFSSTKDRATEKILRGHFALLEQFRAR